MLSITRAGVCEDMCHIPRGSVMIDEAELCHDNVDQANSNAGPDKTDNHTTGWG